MRNLDFLYSPLLKALGEIKQDQAPAKDWPHIIRKLNVPKAEADFINLDDFLENLMQDHPKGQVSRDVILDFVRKNQIQLTAIVGGRLEMHLPESGKPEWTDITEGDVEYAVSDTPEWTDPDYVIETSDAEWPDDDDYWIEEADRYLDEAKDDLMDDLDEDDPEPTEEEILVEAVKLAQSRWEPIDYPATLRDRNGHWPTFTGYFDNHSRKYSFHELPTLKKYSKTAGGMVDDEPYELDEDEAISRALIAWEEGKEKEIERRWEDAQKRGLNDEFQTREEFDAEVRKWEVENAEIVAANAEIDKRNAERGIDIPAGHERYTIAGGEDYFELLVTFPDLHKSGRNVSDSTKYNEASEAVDQFKATYDEHNNNGWVNYEGGEAAWEDHYKDLMAKRNKERLNVDFHLKRPFVQAGHFTEENIVVHLRGKIRKGPEEKPIMVLEEVQSDLATVWRDLYEDPKITKARDDLRKENEELYSLKWKSFDTTLKAFQDQDLFLKKDRADATVLSGSFQVLADFLSGERSYEEEKDSLSRGTIAAYEHLQGDENLKGLIKNHATLIAKEKESQRKLLDLGTEKRIDSNLAHTPFQEENAYALAMKAALRWAAERDMAGLAWTQSYTQAERWGKGAAYVVESLNWQTREFTEGKGERKRIMLETFQGGSMQLQITDEGIIDYDPLNPHRFEGHHISKFFPAPLVKQILETPDGIFNERKFTLLDSGYTVGYDMQMPKAARKILKKMGGKVETINGVEGFGETFEIVLRRLKELPAHEVSDALISSGLETEETIQERAKVVRNMLHRKPELDFQEELKSDLIKRQGPDNLFQAFPKYFGRNHLWYAELTEPTREALLEPIAMFREPILGQYGYMDQTLLEDVRDDLQARLKKLGMSDVSLVLDAQFNKQGASFNYGDGDFAVLIGQTLDPEGTLNHEAIHTLKRKGLFTDAEWSALANEAESSWIEKYDIETRYPNLSREHQIEEAIAEAYVDHAAGERNQPAVRRAFNKIRLFMKSLKEALTAHHVSSPELIFSSVSSGMVGRRVKKEKDLEQDDTTLPGLNASA